MSLDAIKRKIISEKSLKLLRDKYKDKKIVFTSGSFDVIHTGHIIYLNKCKELGDVLVVGLGRNSVIKKLKGKDRPINPENNRILLIAALQDVDYVLFNKETPETIESAELDYIESVSLLRPDIFCINSDNNFLDLNRREVERLGAKFTIMNRDLPEDITPNSTTNILKKLKL